LARATLAAAELDPLLLWCEAASVRGARLMATVWALGVASVALAQNAVVKPTSSPLAAASASAGPGASAQPTHLWSRGLHTRIYAEPRKSKQWIGYIRPGESAKLRDPNPRRGPGCHQGFVAIEPYGYVCLDRQVTLTPGDRYAYAMELLAPRPEPLPFDYALSNGAPMYRRLPSPEEWEKAERFLGPAGSFKPLSWGNRGHEQLAEVRRIPAGQEIPHFLLDGGSASRAKPLGLVRRQIPLGSMLSYVYAIEHEGRAFLVSADGTVVPADRVRPFRESTFRSRAPSTAAIRMGHLRRPRCGGGCDPGSSSSRVWIPSPTRGGPTCRRATATAAGSCGS
jgi:hypothetical protein